MVLYPILPSQSWSTVVPNFMLVSSKAQSGQNLALSHLATQATEKGLGDFNMILLYHFIFYDVYCVCFAEFKLVTSMVFVTSTSPLSK